MKRNAFTLIELMVVVLIIGLLIAILLPSLGEAMEAGKRMQCAANLRGLANTFKIYQQENQDQMPAVPAGYVNATTDPDTSGKVDTQTSLWLMIVAKKSAPEVFICPSDAAYAVAFKGVVEQDKAFPKVNPDGSINETNGKKRSYSYSYQVPNGKYGNPGTANSNNTKYAIMADMAPFQADLLMVDATDFNADNTPTYTDVASARRRLSMNPKVSKKVNSPNHTGKGQNVLFQDGHCKWQPDPWCGVNDDNIYTRATADTETGRVKGEMPTAPVTDASGPFSDDDSWLVNIKIGAYETIP